MTPSENIQLNWTQPSALERHFELHSADSLLGTLHFETASTAYGTLLSTDSATEHWMFKGTGFLIKPRVTIREAGANMDMAVYGGGWVTFVKGSRFHWKPTSLWGTKWGFFNAQEELMFTLKRNFFDLFKTQSAVEIGAQWRDLDELPLLLMLSWYLKVRDSFSTT